MFQLILTYWPVFVLAILVGIITMVSDYYGW